MALKFTCNLDFIESTPNTAQQIAADVYYKRVAYTLIRFHCHEQSDRVMAGRFQMIEQQRFRQRLKASSHSIFSLVRRPHYLRGVKDNTLFQLN